MVSLIAKWQKCGKSNCRCSDGLFLHGPYFWLVKYISKKSNHKRRGKYAWRYLGKNPRDVWEKLVIEDKRFNEKFSLTLLNTKLHSLKQKRKANDNLKAVEEILKIEDTITEK